MKTVEYEYIMQYLERMEVGAARGKHKAKEMAKYDETDASEKMMRYWENGISIIKWMKSSATKIYTGNSNAKNRQEV